ncbi:MAG: hypothetical protein AAF497_00905 [Planctomycetota bacterium]
MWATLISVLAWADKTAKVVGGLKAILLAMTVGLGAWMTSDWWNDTKHAVHVAVVKRRTRRATIIELYRRCDCPDWLDVWNEPSAMVGVSNEILDSPLPPRVLSLEPTPADTRTLEQINEDEDMIKAAKSAPNREGWVRIGGNRMSAEVATGGE